MALGTERILFLFSQRGADALGNSIQGLTGKLDRLAVAQANVAKGAIESKFRPQIAAQRRHLAALPSGWLFNEERYATSGRIERLHDQMNAQMSGVNQTAQRVGIGIDMAKGVMNLAKEMMTLGTAATFATTALAKGGIEMAKLGGSMIGTEQQFHNTAAALNTTAGQLLPAMSQAMSGAVSQMDTMRLANYAVASGLEITDAQLINLAQGAKQLAVVYGRDVSEALERIVQASVKRERRLLDELGIVIRAKDIYAEYAAAHGKTAQELTVEEERTAFLAATIDAVNEKMAQFGGVNFEVATAGDRAKAMIKDFTTALSVMFIESGAASRMVAALGDGLSYLFSAIAGKDGGLTFFTGLVDMFKQLVVFSEIFLGTMIKIMGILDNLAGMFVGGKAGGGLGSIIGSFFGPAGTALGGAIGTVTGGAAGFLLPEFFGKSAADKTADAINPRMQDIENQMQNFQRYLTNRMNSDQVKVHPLPP